VKAARIDVVVCGYTAKLSFYGHAKENMITVQIQSAAPIQIRAMYLASNDRYHTLHLTLTTFLLLYRVHYLAFIHWLITSKITTSLGMIGQSQ